MPKEAKFMVERDDDPSEVVSLFREALEIVFGLKVQVNYGEDSAEVIIKDVK